VVTMRRATPRRRDSARGGAGLFVRCGSDRSDASRRGGVGLPRLAGVHCSAGAVARARGIGWAVRANAGQGVPAWVYGRAPCRSLSTSGASSSRSRRRSAPVTRGLLRPYARPTGHRSGAGVPSRRGAVARRGRGQCHLDRSGGLCGHARWQPMGGDRLPAHDWQHHRARPRRGQGPGQEAARCRGPGGWQAAAIGAHGAAGGALAAPPAGRPLTAGPPAAVPSHPARLVTGARRVYDLSRR
jgi:hypothetical protein